MTTYNSGELIVRATKGVYTGPETIKLGTGLKTADDFCNALEQAGYKVDQRSSDMLGQKSFTVSETEADANLVVVSVATLGFGLKGATRPAIYKRAGELGLSLCPAEVGPQLRLQYADQPYCEYLHIAMEPIAITDSEGDLLSVFVVGHDDDGRWLGYNYGGTDGFWHGEFLWVFYRHK